MPIGSSLYFRWSLLAGMIIRPAATSSRTCSARQVRLARCDAVHLRRDDAEAGVLELRDRLETRGRRHRRVTPSESVKTRAAAHASQGEDA